MVSTLCSTSSSGPSNMGLIRPEMSVIDMISLSLLERCVAHQKPIDLDSVGSSHAFWLQTHPAPPLPPNQKPPPENSGFSLRALRRSVRHPEGWSRRSERRNSFLPPNCRWFEDFADLLKPAWTMESMMGLTALSYRGRVFACIQRPRLATRRRVFCRFGHGVAGFRGGVGARFHFFWGDETLRSKARALKP